MEQLRVPTTKFAMSVFAALRTQQPSGNILFSPMTASSGLLLVYLGSSGSTRAELERAMHIDIGENPTAEHDLQMAYRLALSVLGKIMIPKSGDEDNGQFHIFRINKLFVQKGTMLDDDFVDRIQKLKAEITEIDFKSAPAAARREINAFVADRMNGQLTNCFNEDFVNNSTQLVLANGISFRARWDMVFDRSKTVDLPFYEANGKLVDVPMMRGELHLAYVDDPSLNLIYIEIPYVFNSASLILLLPKTKNGLKEMQNGLQPGVLNRLNLVKRMKEIDLQLPKFKLQNTLSFKQMMSKLGVKKVFTSEADLTKMAPNGNIALSAGCHSGFFSIDENGTQADSSVEPASEGKRKLGKTRSVTSLDDIHGAEFAKVKKPLPVTVDHPFLFAVRHNKSGIMMCFGRIETISP